MSSLGFKCLPLDSSPFNLFHPGMKALSAVMCTDYLSACNNEPAVNFGRLKAQRARLFAQKNSRMKQDYCHHYNLIVKDAPLSVHNSSKFKLEFLEGQKRLDIVRCRCILRGSQSPETKNTAQNVRTRRDTCESELAVMPNVKQPSKSQLLPTKFKRFNQHNVLVSRGHSSLRRRGNEGSTHNIRLSSTDKVKQLGKLPSDSAFFSKKSFRELGCCDTIMESLRNQFIMRPSCIQALAFKPVIGGKCCIIADQSGSGKTLAYLLPVIQRLRQEELVGLSKSLPQSPRVVILVPTAELACQVLRTCRSISRFGVPFHSVVATGGFSQRTQLESLLQNIDVLIATPGRLLFLIREGILWLTNLRCAVLDEVDVLFNNEDYEPALQSLISSSPISIQYLFVTATLPMDIYNKLVEFFPDCEVIMGPGVHRTSSDLVEAEFQTWMRINLVGVLQKCLQILVDCSGDDGTEKTPETAFSNKKSALLQLVEGSAVRKTIIFCNKIETCRKVENVLNRLDRKGTHTIVFPFHAALAQESRLANMEEFCSSQSKEQCLFLVCTDRASRGIDFAGGVDHVVLFDFPRDPSEYVRRVGRTARGAGGKGKAFIFVVGKQVSLARRIIERNRKGHPLHDVPSTSCV